MYGLVPCMWALQLQQVRLDGLELLRQMQSRQAVLQKEQDAQGDTWPPLGARTPL